MDEFKEVYEVRYTQDSEQVTELRTHDLDEAVSKREELIQQGLREPHIQYSFEKGGVVQTSLFGFTDITEDNPNGLVIDQVIENLRSKYITDITDMPEMYDKEGEIVGTLEQIQAKRDETLKWIIDNKASVLIAFSGGKDSVAMVLHAIHDLKIPKDQIELWHHEVDGMGEQLFDWRCTPSYCRAFAKALGLPILFSYADGGILREMYRQDQVPASVFFQKEDGGQFHEVKPRGWDSDKNTRLKFPAVEASLTKRWCSAVAKIDVMGKAIRNWDRFDNIKAVIMTGERRLESKNRAKYGEINLSKWAKGDRKLINWRPIIDWTEQQVWEIYEKYKVQPHPCYELGWNRCSCQLCIFSSKNTWASINKLNPEKVARIAEIEKDMGSKGAAIIAAQEADPSIIPLKKNKETGEMELNPFVNVPLLYGEKVKEERWIPPHQKMTKAGIRNYKGAFKMVWTGERKDIYGSRVDDGESFLEDEAVDRWAEEANGEFVSPIFVEEWKLPLGAYKTENNGAV